VLEPELRLIRLSDKYKSQTGCDLNLNAAVVFTLHLYDQKHPFIKLIILKFQRLCSSSL